ncbi:hypothetical protein SPRG_04069 [Saprolegnia parasitica CBS 223.65]|uniref:MYND-type domain-containing protein n=1 Tax=Saprolegnia parasitica (strain CBS 223.65) TaxID=695850 RepID=A0A067CL65_SAPPC|nr:hypothetical protein SPRG_04069 [Saprolegnia parasitica CBS 223.65]KDO31454.1 hypothetical protein SPRG_04069 [Saprolegnia parasitica CBS 223.65]|eukprot:XP_012198049.1 hypothetical protein SPRG_04069 [Saprolegnia parasitica CBS 223.65]
MAKQFTVVYIPATDDKELAEWQIDLPKDIDGQISCLTERLRAHFKEQSCGASSAEQREAFRQQILAQMPKGSTMNDEVMSMMLQMDSLVDSVPLITNSAAAKHIGVNLYVDDKGTAKNLPLNMRASAIAQACGRMLEVRGDAFIGRVFDNDDAFVRMDFKLSEINADAEWIKIAQSQTNPQAAAKAPVAPATNGRVCGSPSCSAKGVHRCSRCQAEYYCSADCQKSHWRVHKLSCKKP